MKQALYHLLFLFACMHPCKAQNDAGITARTNALRILLSRADNLDPLDGHVEDISDTIASVNEDIYNALSDILQDSSIRGFDIDSLLSHPYLTITHSRDGNLWNFSWPEKTGGSNRTDKVLFGYRTSRRDLKVARDISGDADSHAVDISWAFGSGMDTMYRLNAKGKSMYLGRISGQGCNTCLYETAGVIELRNDSIYFDYPAFKNTDTHAGNEYRPYYTVSARWGGITEFAFDPGTQILKYAYVADDLNDTAGRPGRKITGAFKFEDEKFSKVKHRQTE